MINKKRIGIIGAGASGIACALFLREEIDDVEIVLFERNERIAKKILKTGNGKCNLSNLDLKPNYFFDNFAQYPLHNFSIEQCIDFFHRNGIWTKFDEDGRLYPYSEKANTVVDGFMHALVQKDINIKTEYDVNHIKITNRFLVYSTQYEVENVDYLVFAMGSAAGQKEKVNYELITNLGHTCDKIRPGLTTFLTSTNTKSISGIRMKALVKLIKKNVILYQTIGEVLFKDQGLSGIAIMDVSNYYVEDSYIELDLVYDQSDESLYSFLSLDLENRIFGLFPKMIALDILKRTANKRIEEVMYEIHHYRFNILQPTGMQQAQIVIGGINKQEINPYTMESNAISNLYVIGELLGVGGKCGGYNLHFAWTSGYMAAKNIIKKIKGESCGKSNQ